MPQDLRSTLPALAELLLGYALLQMGNMLLGTLLSVRGTIEHFWPSQIGAVGAGFWVGALAGSLGAGRLIRRVGYTQAFAALSAIAAAGALLHLLVIDWRVWVAARALNGFCFAGLFIVVESWLNAVASATTRGRILSVYGMTGMIATIGGQMALTFGNPAGYRLFCIVSMIISVAVAPLALSRTRAPLMPRRSTQVDLRLLNRRAPFGVVAAALCGVSTGSFFALGPAFAAARHFTTQEIAIFMACGSLGGLALTWPIGWLSDRIDRRVVVIGTAAIAAISLMAMPVLLPKGSPVWMYYVCVGVFGSVVIPTYSVVAAHVNDLATPEEFVAASGGLLILFSLGAALGPVAAGAAMGQLGPVGLVYAIVAAQAAMALWGVYRIIARGPTPEEAKEPFRPEPSVAVSTQLQPTRFET